MFFWFLLNMTMVSVTVFVNYYCSLTVKWGSLFKYNVSETRLLNLINNNNNKSLKCYNIAIC